MSENQTSNFIKLNLTSRTILIVEDDPLTVKYLFEFLNRTKANLIIVHNGEEAIDAVKSSPEIDLVLMDLELPELDGFNATQMIKSIRPDLPIIAQTAHALPSYKEKADEAGCDEYITKPYSFTEVLSAISKYLKQSGD